ANQRMRNHSAAQGPAATNRNATYDSTETKAAANATAGRPATARGRHLSQPDAASPPSPMAASTTASMRLTVSVLATTNIDRKRNQTTSNAMRLPPARNAHASSRHATGPVVIGRGIATSGATPGTLRSSPEAFD